MIHYTKPNMPKTEGFTSRGSRYSKMALRIWIKDIHFTQPVEMKRVHGDIINEVGSEAQDINNKYNI